METDSIRALLKPSDEPQDELALSYALMMDGRDTEDLAQHIDDENLPAIMQEARGDRDRELEIVNDRLGTIAWVNRELDRFIALARRELDRLEAYIERFETLRERRVGYMQRIIEDWRRERGDPSKSGRTYDLPNGKVGMRKTRGRTRIVDDAVIAYALARAEEGDDDLLNTVLERKWVVRGAEVRKRFEIASNGAVVDKATGAVLEPQTYYGEDGTLLSAPLLVQTEPPGDKFVLEVRGAKTLKEAETDGG